MTNEEILKKAIDKAKANDSEYNSIDPWMNYDSYIPDAEFAVIFNHEFAKAFWGESPICNICGGTEFSAGESFNGESTEYDPFCKGCGTEPADILEFGNSDGTTYPAYLYHLQQMVLKEDPIKYLEKFI